MEKMKPLHADKKEVLEIVSCYKAAQFMGLKMKTNSRTNRISIECPFHEERLGQADRHIGNCKISKNGKICYCFSCNGSGNAIDMVMAHEKLSFCEAVDWLASMEAPELISEDWIEQKGSNRNVCPFSKKDFEIIGIHTEDAVFPVGMASSKFEARKHSLCYTDILYPDQFTSDKEGYGVLLCVRDHISITDIWKENRSLFISIVEPKAVLAYEKYRKDIVKVNTIFDKYGISNEDPLRKAVMDEYKSKIRIAQSFLGLT